VSRAKKPPVITSQWGETTEWARKMAAENMLLDPAVKFRVEQLLIKKFGGDEKRGLAEARRLYPEAYITQ
jgi:hypothetical protein